MNTTPNNTTKLLDDFCFWLSRCTKTRQRKDGKFLLKAEKRMVAQLQTVLKQQQDFFVKAIEKMPSFNSVATNSIDDEIDNVLAGMPGQKKLVETIVVYGKGTMKKGGERTVQQLALKKFGISFTLTHPEAVAYFADKRKLELSNFKGNITATTKDRIKEIVTTAIENGQSYTETAKQIAAQGQTGVFSKSRAQLIATHEAGNAYEQGRKYPINDFIADNPDRSVIKQWLTVGGGVANNVTPEHTENENEGWIAYDGTFKGTGDSEPPASDNPRCRCTIAYDIP